MLTAYGTNKNPQPIGWHCPKEVKKTKNTNMNHEWKNWIPGVELNHSQNHIFLFKYQVKWPFEF